MCSHAEQYDCKSTTMLQLTTTTPKKWSISASIFSYSSFYISSIRCSGWFNWIALYCYAVILFCINCKWTVCGKQQAGYLGFLCLNITFIFLRFIVDYKRPTLRTIRTESNIDGWSHWFWATIRDITKKIY